MKTDYRIMLKRRAAFAEPRADEAADHLALANAQARAAWYQRWHERRPHIDPWAGVGMAREFFDFYLLKHRVAALAWLEQVKRDRFKVPSLASVAHLRIRERRS